MSQIASRNGAKMAVQKTAAVNEAIRARIQPKNEVKETENIKNNSFFKIMFEGSKSPKERKTEWANYIASTLDAVQDRARMKEFEAFSEYLQSQTTNMAEEIIRLTDTKTYATLQRVIEDMNNGLMNFEEVLSPLMEIAEAIHQLNTNGALMTAYREISYDKDREDQLKADKAKMAEEIEENQKQIEELERKNAALSQKRSWGGFGGIKEEARAEIAQNELEVSNNKKEIEEAQLRLDELSKKSIETESSLGEMAIHKEKLRELLNLSSEENVERMVALQRSALDFVQKSRDSTDSVRGEFGVLADQLNKAEDNNRKMTSVYAIMTEGMKDAAQMNIDKRNDLANNLKNSGDDLIAKMDAEDKIRNLDSHSKLLHSAQGETISAYAELSQQAIRVGAMKDTTQEQLDIARKLNTQGVSSTADRLASVMTAVSSAAIKNSADVVKSVLNDMREKTTVLTQKSVIQNAMYVDAINNDMEKVFMELESFRDTQQVSSSIVREGLATMNANMQAIMQEARKVNEESKNLLALSTQMSFVDGVNETQTNTETNKESNDPFQ